MTPKASSHLRYSRIAMLIRSEKIHTPNPCSNSTKAANANKYSFASKIYFAQRSGLT